MATLGQQRVRLDFNPDEREDVKAIKESFADMIDRLEEMKRQGKEPRTCAVAQTEAENACMWAVKAATS